MIKYHCIFGLLKFICKIYIWIYKIFLNFYLYIFKVLSDMYPNDIFFTYIKYFYHIHSLPFLFPNMPHLIFTSYMYICKYMWNTAYFISHLLATLSQGYICVWFLSSLYILDIQLAGSPFCRLFAYSFVSTCERKHDIYLSAFGLFC